jgi:hypothetical protein
LKKKRKTFRKKKPEIINYYLKENENELEMIGIAKTTTNNNIFQH